MAVAVGCHNNHRRADSHQLALLFVVLRYSVCFLCCAVLSHHRDLPITIIFFFFVLWRAAGER